MVSFSPRTSPGWVAFALLATFIACPTWADELRGTRGQDLVEVSHIVDATLENGVATYRVRRTFLNKGKQTEEARLEIDLPYGAVATGLRIKSGTRWFDGELMHRDKAEELYRELTGLGPSEPKDPALLYWRWPNALALRVFPIFSGKTSTVEYTLTAPTEYHDGIYSFNYPRNAGPNTEQHSTEEPSNLVAPLFRIQAPGLSEVFEDGELRRSRELLLNEVPLHPILKQLHFTDSRVLVRPLLVATRGAGKEMKLSLDIAHTWQGDMQLDLVDPNGTLHTVRAHDFSLSENDLRADFSISYEGEVGGLWHLLITDHHPLDGGTLRSWSLSPVLKGSKDDTPERRVRDAVPTPIPQPHDGSSDVATIGLRMRAPEKTQLDPTRVRYGRVALVEEHQFARLEVDMGRRLSQLPKNQSVVFVLDLSHTMGKSGIDSQLRLVRSYLTHLPDAEFALIGVRRFAEVLTDFTPASRLTATLADLQQSTKLAPNNGSFLDRGTQAASDLIATLPTPDQATAVILLTDNLLRADWDQSVAQAAIGGLPQNTVVHVAETHSGGYLSIEREDDHRLFPLARARGGVAVSASGIADAKEAALDDEMLYLVRPTRLDFPRFADFDLKDSLPDGSQIREGQSVRWMSGLRSVPLTTELQGQLWSKPVTFAATQSEPFHRATAGFVFSQDHYTMLSEAEQFVIASYARAVSPVTSYLAIEPGVRPSTDGFEEFSSQGFGSGHGKLYGSGSSRAPDVNWAAVKQGARDACAAHTSTPSAAQLRVEVQDREIANVTIDSTPTPFSKCVLEWLWAYQLPAGTRGKYVALLKI